jgi:hypothetical protein
MKGFVVRLIGRTGRENRSLIFTGDIINSFFTPFHFENIVPRAPHENQ